MTTGLVLQELLQGFRGPAANLRNRCRRKGVQIGTIDALIARLCIHHELSLLTTDSDFTNVARYCGLEVARVGQA